MRSVDRPSMDETLMTMAFVMSSRGTCSRARNGAVFALDGRVLSTGYNGAPRGLPHCHHAADDVHTVADGATRSTCSIAVHAEANAVAFAARHGVKLDGSTLFTTMTPCLACAQLLVSVGVRRVVMARAYRDDAGLRLLRSALILVEYVDTNESEDSP